MEGPSAGWRWVCLKGNHEAMMLAALEGDPDTVNWWIGNGGDQTLQSYAHASRGGFDASIIPAAHRAWRMPLPLFHSDEHRIYVHAAVDPNLTLDRQLEHTLIWERYPGYLDTGWATSNLVHGHDPREDGPVLLSRRTDLDTLAWRTGRLVVGVTPSPAVH
jgi:serine/threonine protein phosphatase 1